MKKIILSMVILASMASTVQAATCYSLSGPGRVIGYGGGVIKGGSC